MTILNLGTKSITLKLHLVSKQLVRIACRRQAMETFPPTSVDGNVSYVQGLGSSVTLPPQQPYPSAVVIICSIVLLVSPIIAACCKLRSRRRQPQTVPNTVDGMLQTITAKEVKVKRIDLYIQHNSIVSNLSLSTPVRG